MCRDWRRGPVTEELSVWEGCAGCVERRRLRLAWLVRMIRLGLPGVNPLATRFNFLYAVSGIRYENPAVSGWRKA